MVSSSAAISRCNASSCFFLPLTVAYHPGAVNLPRQVITLTAQGFQFLLLLSKRSVLLAHSISTNAVNIQRVRVAVLYFATLLCRVGFLCNSEVVHQKAYSFPCQAILSMYSRLFVREVRKANR